jgi:hypothetical protein
MVYGSGKAATELELAVSCFRCGEEERSVSCLAEEKEAGGWVYMEEHGDELVLFSNRGRRSGSTCLLATVECGGWLDGRRGAHCAEDKESIYVRRGQGSRSLKVTYSP